MKIDELDDPELQKRLRDAGTPEEMLEISQEYGFELEDSQLEAISGGSWCSSYCTKFYYCKCDGPL